MASEDSVLIVGGGLAGLFCALKLAPKAVTIVAAAPIGKGASSAWAQAGIAAAVGEGDTVAKHIADTIAAGDGIVDEAVIAGMAAEAPARVHDLLEYGVPFDRDLEGRLAVSREAAHSESRIVRVRGDMAGAAIMKALETAVERTPSIRILEGHVAESLAVEDGRVVGVNVRPEGGAGEMFQLLGADVVMASGGIGHLYAVTTNPAEARGGGIGMAARAGARMADMEFVQFHPTAIDIGRDPAPLATEALRGHGATLVNAAGERFMLPIHPDAELAPRDVVARGIFAEVKAGRGAFLDCREAIGTSFAEEFPTVHASCVSAGIDPATDLIPVVPATHYFMGGIWTDAEGRTSLPGLWACGEVTSTGAHGANRLASNSLLEAVVFAHRVAEALKREGARDAPAGWSDASVEWDSSETHADTAGMRLLRRTMSAELGVVRDGAGMRAALGTILALEDEATDERFRNMLVTAKLIAISALNRTESRGGHFRTDFPEQDNAWRRRTLVTLDQAEAAIPDLMETENEP